jgi:hypothetical protein
MHSARRDAQAWLVQRNWPLFSRAWIFQEYLLSPRKLLLGQRNLMWQCSEGFYDELVGPVVEAWRGADDTKAKQGRDVGKSRYFPASLRAGFGEDAVMSAPVSLAFMIDWQALVNEYRSRELTMGERSHRCDRGDSACVSESRGVDVSRRRVVGILAAFTVVVCWQEA